VPGIPIERAHISRDGMAGPSLDKPGHDDTEFTC